MRRIENSNNDCVNRSQDRIHSFIHSEANFVLCIFEGSAPNQSFPLQQQQQQEAQMKLWTPKMGRSHKRIQLLSYPCWVWPSSNYELETFCSESLLQWSNHWRFLHSRKFCTNGILRCWPFYPSVCLSFSASGKRINIISN